MATKKTNMFKDPKPVAKPKRSKQAQSVAKHKGAAAAPAAAPTAAEQIEAMSEEQKQATEQYLQTTAALAKRLVDDGVAKRSPGTGLQQYYGAYAVIEEAVGEAMDLLARKLNKPNVAELAAALSGLIGKVIAEASTRGVKKPVTEDMFNSLEKMFGAGVRLTTIEGQRIANSQIVTPTQYKGPIH